MSRAARACTPLVLSALSLMAGCARGHEQNESLSTNSSGDQRSTAARRVLIALAPYSTARPFDVERTITWRLGAAPGILIKPTTGIECSGTHGFVCALQERIIPLHVIR